MVLESLSCQSGRNHACLITSVKNMSSQKKKLFADYGPYSYRNWLAQAENKVNYPYCIIEIELFSDACFKGTEVDHGPYTLINAEPFPPIQPSYLMHGRLVLHYGSFLDPNKDPTSHPNGTDTSMYHGGGLRDEMAALYSLCFGSRIKAGGTIRKQRPWDKYPKPRIPRPDETPIFSHPHDERYLLPWHIGEKKMGLVQEHINNYIKLKPRQASTLIRAARLYQDAVWLSENNPELSWLLLGSSVEVAADYAYTERNSDPVKQFKELKPTLAEALNGLGEDSQRAIEIVSSHLEGLIGSTKKFRQFLCDFAPIEPPTERPPYQTIRWDKPSLKKVFNKIYDYRSKALHGGTPFPEPMCRPPEKGHKDKSFVEYPSVGIAGATLGSSWKAQDVPIHLHIFEYIVRYSLLRWWQNMTTSS